MANTGLASPAARTNVTIPVNEIALLTENL